MRDAASVALPEAEVLPAAEVLLELEVVLEPAFEAAVEVAVEAAEVVGLAADVAGAEDTAGADELGADELDTSPLIGSVTCALGGAALRTTGLLCGAGVDTSEAGELPHAVSSSVAEPSAAPTTASRRRDARSGAPPSRDRAGRPGAEAGR